MEILTPVSPDNYLDWFNLESRPLLKLANENSRPAYAVSIEWIVESSTPTGWKRKALRNYTQIMRHPFQRKRKQDGSWESFAEAAKAAGERILDDIELTLWYGKPGYDLNGYMPISTCGGVYHYLGRRLYENDTVALRPLRTLVLLKSRGEHDEFLEEELHTHEWLTEFSLQVNPGHYERGMKPIAVPPKRQKSSAVTAFPQGSTLGQGVAVALH